MAQYFKAADMLIPKHCDMQRWSVIACDQFTSDPAYWQRVRKFVNDSPSTLHMILPEAELGTADDAVIGKINDTMLTYLNDGIFSEFKQSYVYVERTLQNGSIRQGIIGMIDLAHYEYNPALHPIKKSAANSCSQIPLLIPGKRVFCKALWAAS